MYTNAYSRHDLYKKNLQSNLKTVVLSQYYQHYDANQPANIINSVNHFKIINSRAMLANDIYVHPE